MPPTKCQETFRVKHLGKTNIGSNLRLALDRDALSNIVIVFLRYCHTSAFQYFQSLYYSVSRSANWAPKEAR